MPTSEYDPDDAPVPATPDGYRAPRRFDYSVPAILGIGLLAVPVAGVAFGAVLWHAQGAALDAIVLVEETATSVSFTVDAGLVAVAFVGGIVVVTVAHELVHGLVYQRLGYRASYGVAPGFGAFYAAAFHQFQRRNDNLLVGIAPLVVLDLLLLPALFVPNPGLAFAAYLGLVFNTAGAAGDVYLVARLASMPAGTLTYDSDVRHSYVFYPRE